MGRVADDDRTLEEVPSESTRSSGHADLHIALECDRPLAGSTRHCLDDVDEVVFGRGRERQFRRELLSGVRTLTLEVPDSRMSLRHAKLHRFDRRWALEDAGSRNGSYLQGRRVARAPLIDGSMFELGHTHFLFRSRPLSKKLVGGPPDVAAPASREPALGTLSHEREALFAQLVEATRAGASILLIGEAGSGKDTLAHALHVEAGRRRPFVAVRCMLLGRGPDSSPTDDDVVAELTRDFERAAGGTLFLDEIEGLSPVAQLALLPLLKSAQRAGVARIMSSVRSSDLRPEVPRIPADLLAELAGFAMPVQPLRDRREDIGTLVAQILRRGGGADPTRITMDPVMGQALLLHDWPYNISELDRCVRSAVALSTNECIRWSPATLFHLRGPTVRDAVDDPMPPRSPRYRAESPPEPDAEFVQNVRRALKCNLSVPGLQKNGLLGAHMVLEATKGSSAATVAVPALRDIILSAIESLRSSSPRGDKQSRVLHLTFIKPTSTQQEAAEQLAMAFGTYRRYVTSALAELTSILWFNESSARLRRERQLGAGSSAGAASEPTLDRSG
jgi:sigma-54 dependent transcriptional regulator, acetoin dehydrogenase operon transcriptional activator AcoR